MDTDFIADLTEFEAKEELRLRVEIIHELRIQRDTLLQALRESQSRTPSATNQKCLLTVV